MSLPLSGGQGPAEQALQAYDTAWQHFIVENELTEFVQMVMPTAIGWKVADKHALLANLEAMANETEQVHIGTVNERFIASVVLHEPYHGARIIKILERRHGSADPLGLDHIDYLVNNASDTFDILQSARGGHVAKERNDMHAWLSLRFGPDESFEAKFVDHLVLEVACRELQAADQAIRTALGIA